MALLLTRPVVEVLENANAQTLQADITTALGLIYTAAAAQNPEAVQVAGLIDQNSLQVSDISIVLDSNDAALYYCTVRYNVLF